MLRILILIGLLIISIIPVMSTLQAQTISSTTSIFRELGIELSDPVADTYYVGDAILIRGRVTDGRQHALIYLKNIKTGESISELAETSATGEFSYPLSFPVSEGEYTLIIASGNSFNTQVHYQIQLVANQVIGTSSAPIGIRPIFVPTPSPYLSIGSDVWAMMTIQQGKKVSKTQGKILSLAGLPLQYGTAQISLQGYRLMGPSSQDRSASGVTWTGSVYIDRIREMIGQDLVSLRVLRSVATMQMRIPQGKKVRSQYYITTPSGDVIEGKYAPQYIGTDGYLKNGVNIRQSFSVADPGVYKIEAVSANGYAYFNLPISRSPFWGVKEALSQDQKNTLRTDKRLIDRDILARINTLRTGLGITPLTIDKTLSELAQYKALDMAKYNYVRHDAQNGLYIEEFGKAFGIVLSAPYGENVAGGNISDISLQDGLEESGSHRHSMIARQYQKIGIGYASQNGKAYLVEIFGK